MTLKALAEAALQQCAPRTIPAQSNADRTAHYDSENGHPRTLPNDETEAMRIASRTIAMAALTDEQTLSRLADLRRDPAIARFWELAWPEARITPPDERA